MYTTFRVKLYPSMSISNSKGLKLYGDDLLLYNLFSIEVFVKGWAIHLSYVDRRTDMFC